MIDRAPGAARSGRTARIGATGLTVLAGIAIGFSYLDAGNGIAFSGGALFALILALVALLCGVMLLRRPTPRWLRILLGLALAGCLLGAGVSAYFLEAAAALLCLIAAMLAWLAVLVLPRSAVVGARA